MGPQRLSNLSAVRRQHLLVEFSSLKAAAPHGVYMSLTPGDPTLWSGVLFVRKGPYSPSVLHFQVSFPSTYPALPPLVTFSTDIFHPLLTPLTTQVYSTDSLSDGTVSATDEERLPPGGFSLRAGFPGWFGRATRVSLERSRKVRVASLGSGQVTPKRDGGGGGGVDSPGSSAAGFGIDASGGGSGSTISGIGRTRYPTTFEVLRYIRSSFDDADVLDRVPLEAAGNSGAWQAWRAYRVKIGVISSPTTERSPGEWNWDGVWEERVRRGVEGSVGENALFGKEAGSDLIRFLHLESDVLERIKGDMERSLGREEGQRRGIV